MSVRATARRILIEAAELPGFNLISRRYYDRVFERNSKRNLFRGVFETFQAAAAALPANRLHGYDNAESAAKYRDRMDVVRASDYPPLFWVSKFLDEGCRSVLDVGGHIGVAYYAFQRYVDFPDALAWCVQDVPAVVEAGRAWAADHDAKRRLRFEQRLADCPGADLLLAMGSLQYLDITLPELIGTLARKPRQLILSQVPLHPTRSFFTINSIGTSFCPYRITAVDEFVAGVEGAGYRVRGRWQSHEKQIHIPFSLDHSFDHYSGFSFSLNDP